MYQVFIKTIDCLKRIKEYQTKQSPKFDFILVTGDFVSLKPKEKTEEKYIKQAEKEIREVMQLLETICPNVIYIGGNHEPIIIFPQPYPSMSVNSINLHQGFVTFDTNLYVASFAGAVPLMRLLI